MLFFRRLTFDTDQNTNSCGFSSDDKTSLANQGLWNTRVYHAGYDNFELRCAFCPFLENSDSPTDNVPTTKGKKYWLDVYRTKFLHGWVYTTCPMIRPNDDAAVDN